MSDAIRYFFDEHIDPDVADGVRALGIDALTVQDAGRCGIADPDQLTVAESEGRVMVTLDADYLVLHAAGAPHAGIAWVPAKKCGTGYLVSALALLHGACTPAELRNHVEYL
ncbi:MAG: DUF5615 family PIN-like protein [Fimbriiglobus sp.]